MEYFKYLREFVGHQPIILPGSVVIIINEKNEILLQQRLNGNWGLPGGLMDLGESFEKVAKREVYEETALVVEELKLLNVYSGEKYYLKVENGDELYSATAVYYTDKVSGKLTVNHDEAKDLKYFTYEQIPARLSETDRGFIKDYISKMKSMWIKSYQLFQINIKT